MADPNIRKEYSFQWLRLALCFSVIVMHSARFIDGNNTHEPFSMIFGIKSPMGFGIGDLAVDCFFTLSGYFITQSWSHRTSNWMFICKRISRIYPPFIAANIIVLLILGPILNQDISTYIKSIDYKREIINLIKINGPSVRLFAGTKHPYGNGVIWTLCFEFRLYLFTLLSGFIPKNFGKFRATGYWIIMVAVSLSTAVILMVHKEDQSFISFLKHEEYFLRFVGCYAMGALLQLHKKALVVSRKMAWLLAIAFISSLIYEPSLPLTIILILPLVTILFTQHSGVFNKLPAIEHDISYGIYLFAWPIQKTILLYFPTIPLLALIGAASAIAFCFGIANLKYIESPITKLYNSFAYKVRT